MKATAEPLIVCMETSSACLEVAAHTGRGISCASYIDNHHDAEFRTVDNVMRFLIHVRTHSPPSPMLQCQAATKAPMQKIMVLLSSLPHFYADT